MIILRTLIGAVALVSFFSNPSLASEDTLSISQAVSIAIRLEDPSVSAYSARAASEDDLGVSMGQLPDPKVKFGIANIATDSFKFNQEAMTQMQLGAHQSFPSAKKRSFMRARGKAKGSAYRQMAAARTLAITLEVRKLWLRIYMLEASQRFIKAKKGKMAEMIETLENKFGSGYSTAQTSVQKLLTMETELALLDDKIEETEQRIVKTRVFLSRYIGEENAAKLLTKAVNLAVPKPENILEETLNLHPLVVKEEALVTAADKSVAIAKENYKPNWGLDVGYGLRGGGRSDMATAMVTFDVPLFTGKRQDKRLSAAKNTKQSALLTKRVASLNLLRDMRASFSVWTRTSARIDLYNKVLLERAKAASRATEVAYAANNTDFAEIIRTHISELNAHINLEKIKFERAAAQAELLYFEGVGQ